MANYSEKPRAYEPVGNGSFLYRFNIQEVTEQQAEVQTLEGGEAEAQEPRTSWNCDEVTVYPPVTANSITEAVIAHKWDASYEKKLINEYNAAKLGLIGGSTTSAEAKAVIEKYKAFLVERQALKDSVDATCLELGIH